MIRPPGVPPENPEFAKDAAMTTGTLIAIEHGAVQFIGRRQFALQDEVITVPIPHLFTLMGTLLVMLSPDHPAFAAMRGLFLALAPMPSVPPKPN
jgi:hypothetical protein